MFDQTRIDRIEQLDQMREGVDYRFKVKVRGYTITLRPLSVLEIRQCVADSSEEYEGLPSSHLKNKISQDLIYAKKVIVRSSTTDVDLNDPKITDLIVDRMTNDELQCLWKEYIACCERCDPMFERMSQEDVAELIDAVKKKQASLIDCSFLELVKLCRHLMGEEQRTDK